MNMKNQEIPKTEHIVEQYAGRDHRVIFVMTADVLCTTYTLYRVVDGKYERVGKCSSPIKLEEKYSVNSYILGDIAK